MSYKPLVGQGFTSGRGLHIQYLAVATLSAMCFSPIHLVANDPWLLLCPGWDSTPRAITTVGPRGFEIYQTTEKGAHEELWRGYCILTLICMRPSEGRHRRSRMYITQGRS